MGIMGVDFGLVFFFGFNLKVETGTVILDQVDLVLLPVHSKLFLIC